MQYTFKGVTFDITAKIQDKKAPWAAGNSYKVTVKNINTGKKISFDYWDSVFNQEHDIDINLMDAFQCFVEDAYNGSSMPSVSYVMSEFGYEDKMEAQRVSRGLINMYNKACKIGIPELDFNELLDALNG